MQMTWFGVLAIVTLTVFVGHELWRRRARRCFVRQRPLLTDAAFCEAIAAVPAERRWWVELRRALAIQCGLPTEAVGPDDGLDTLERMTVDGWDFFELLCTLEARLNIPVGRLIEEHPIKGKCPETVRGLGEGLAETLRAAAPQLKR
jgi:hypothetical protein